MAELDEMITSLLQDPKSIEMISSLLSGKDGEAPALPALPDGFDPAKLSKLVKSLGGPPDERTKLLLALRPFLAPSRRQKLDRSIKILKLLKLADEMGGFEIV